ncbi:MAG TPA: gamma-glutamyltransferase [Solimonas sp.]|nr:gamma-glutamyltransferase [Solimonas sp.]
MAIGANPPGDACATAHPLATDACIEILAAGGNAFDAAIAASAAIAVVEPTGSGIGGGGFWLLHRQSDGFEVFIDGRETAPGAASRDMYLDASGAADPKRSRSGALAAAIPGEPAALDHLAREYGRLPLARVLAPAIRYAREGFAIDPKLAGAIGYFAAKVSPAAQAVLAPGGRPLQAGERLVQADLAQVLERLASQGARGFYGGATAQALVEGVRAAGGLWTAEDLLRYRVVERRPVETFFRDYRIVTAPPPSAGGVALAQIFQQLELVGWRNDGSVLSRHLVIEAMRRAYRDRATYLGDPDFTDIPLHRLLSRSHARTLAAGISRERATPSAELAPAAPVPEGSHTSHLSVIDHEGNRVAATMSINLPFGSGYIAPGTGVFLNDEMDDFSASVGASNAYGLIGSVPNSIAPHKRPLSSMSPTFVEGPRGVLALGTPGGSRIVTMVALGILAWIEGGSALQVAALPRYHHQYLPDVVEFEAAAFDAPTQAGLAALGHVLKPIGERGGNIQPNTYGNMQVVAWSPRFNTLEAAGDPRAVGSGRVLVAKP